MFLANEKTLVLKDLVFFGVVSRGFNVKKRSDFLVIKKTVVETIFSFCLGLKFDFTLF